MSEDSQEKRIQHVETVVDSSGKKLVQLETTIKGYDGRLTNVEAGVSALQGGMNQLLQRGSSYEAQKGMIPASTVKWGVGALLTLVGLGLVILQIFLGSIREDIVDERAARQAVSSNLRTTQDKALVNETKAEERYQNQLEWNKAKVEWNRRIVDRSLADKKEFLLADKELRSSLATKATTLDLRTVQRDQQVQISTLRIDMERFKAELEYVQLIQDRRYTSIMENSKRSSDHSARLKQAEEELDKRWGIIIQNAEKLGKLEPIIKGMGLTLPVGNEKRIQLLEKLLDAIDKEGSRGTNLRLKGGS